jgi:Methylene-tetrahydrofolate reductase C terminal
MRAARHWSVRHARGLETCYRSFERAIVALHPVWRRLGYARLERPVAAVERTVKGFLFDCRMCGQCVLSSTGMSCPMNCPKELRNGPCGGVRADGRCEVDPQMPCVWVEAIAGSARMREGRAAVQVVQFAVDRRLAGRSSWLALARERHETSIETQGRGRRKPTGT